MGIRFNSLDDVPEPFRSQLAAQIEKRPASRGTSAAAQLSGRQQRPFRSCSHEGCGDGTGCTAPARYELLLPGRPLTTNRLISALFIADPGTRAARTAEVGRTYRDWKRLGYEVSIRDRIPTLAQVWITVQALYQSRRSMADPGGLTMVGKAVIDGAVQAGVLVDDRGGIVRGELYLEPVVDQAGDGVRVVFSTVPLWDLPLHVCSGI